MPITRAGLADEIDGFDVQIKALNEAKSAAYKTYREQLEDAGMEPRRASAEVAATKAAIAKRRKLRENPDAAREKDDLIDAILVEIMESPSRAREASYSEAKGMGFLSGLTDEQKAAALAYDGEDGPVGEITDNQDQIGGNGPDLPVEASTEKQAAGSSRPTPSNSAAHSPAERAGEAPSSSQASPATLSDMPISTTPSFAGRVTGDMPDIPDFLRRTERKAREWEEA